MAFPERFSNLPEYAFPRLRSLLDPHEPGAEPIVMTIGEPCHPFPDWLGAALQEAIAGFGKYPVNDGTDALQGEISNWISRRYGVAVDPVTDILPLNGTREGLFNACLALCPEEKAGGPPLVLMPNPFYQVYAVAALAVGAGPRYIPATEATGFLPDFASLDAATLDQTAIVYICSPANPQGAVADMAYWETLLSLAEKHDFTVLADECYAEIWRTAPPVGALEARVKTGVDPDRLVVFHSLSKRSNVPGLRSGFAAGGAGAIARMKQLRAYAGAPLPGPIQAVSARLWADDTHVAESRALYQAKYAMADDILRDVPGYSAPEAGFFLWLPVDDGEAAALTLWREAGVRVLPGHYLARSVDGHTPGHDRIRVAMVAPEDETRQGLLRLRETLYG